MSKRSYYRIKIEGKLGYDIQGVGLREIIRLYASKRSLNGFVKNERDGSVVIVCKGTEKNIEPFCKDLNERLMLDNPLVKANLPVKKEKLNPSTAELLYKFNEGFCIEREDDLKEMVWALQAAGKVFAEQGRKAKERQLSGLNFEINELSKKIEALTPGSQPPKLRTLAMENVLTQPTFAGKLLGLTSEIYNIVQELNASGTVTQTIENLRELVRTFLEEVKKEAEKDDLNLHA